MHPSRGGRSTDDTRPEARRRRLAGAPVALALGVALCAGAVLSVVLPVTAQGTSSDVTVVNDPTFGTILANGGGLALYTLNTDHSGQSTCNSTCLAVWPPLTVASGSSPTAGAGVPTGSLGTAVQSDGRTQVTYNGSPLYTFVGDTPGHTTGQGISGFYVVQVSSTSPTTTAPPPSTTVTNTPSTTVTTAAPGRTGTTTVPSTAPRAGAIATTSAAGTKASSGGSGASGGSGTSTGGGAGGGATAASGGSTPAPASAPGSLAFTGVGDWLKGTALAGMALALLGGLVLLFLSPAASRRAARPVPSETPGR